MAANDLDDVFRLLANNEALYQKLINAIEAEAAEARNILNSLAVRALYHQDEVPQACGQGGVYQTWQDILARLRRFQRK